MKQIKLDSIGVEVVKYRNSKITSESEKDLALNYIDKEEHKKFNEYMLQLNESYFLTF